MEGDEQHTQIEEKKMGSRTQEGLPLSRRTLILEQKRPYLIATAHHKEDQVETVLMKLLRGSHISKLQSVSYLNAFNKLNAHISFYYTGASCFFI